MFQLPTHTRQRRARGGAPAALATGALLAIAPVASAQPALPPAVTVAQSPEMAAVRARFEPMSPADLARAGYRIDPVCVSVPQLGGMGFHAVNPTLYDQQFGSGKLDPQQPSIVLVDAHQRVVGLEWEASQRVPAPVLFGQTLGVQPGHEGLEEPHYMLHAYFQPQGQVMFGVFDPQVQCPPPGVARDGQRLATQSAGTQATFQAVWGAQAPERWSLEHNIELTRQGK